MGQLLISIQNDKNPEIIADILKNYPESINERDETGRTPLMYAVKRENIKIIELLLKAGAEIEGSDNNKDTPLVFAVSNRNKEIIQMLLKAGANPSATNINEKSVLNYAVNTNICDVNIVRMLLEAGADLKQADITGGTPLMYAVKRENIKIIELLLKAGADQGEEDTGKTPLIYEVEEENIKNIELLLNAGADPNKADKTGITPLLYAVDKENIKIIELLLEKGADPGQTDINEATALMVAAYLNNIVIVDALLATSKSKPEHVNAMGETALMYSFYDNPNLEIADKIFDSGESNPGHILRIENRDRSALHIVYSLYLKNSRWLSLLVKLIHYVYKNCIDRKALKKLTETMNLEKVGEYTENEPDKYTPLKQPEITRSYYILLQTICFEQRENQELIDALNAKNKNLIKICNRVIEETPKLITATRNDLPPLPPLYNLRSNKKRQISELNNPLVESSKIKKAFGDNVIQYHVDHIINYGLNEHEIEDYLQENLNNEEINDDEKEIILNMVHPGWRLAIPNDDRYTQQPNVKTSIQPPLPPGRGGKKTTKKRNNLFKNKTRNKRKTTHKRK